MIRQVLLLFLSTRGLNCQHLVRNLAINRVSLLAVLFQVGTDEVTIAACYLSSEGVVLGADSTASYPLPSGEVQYLEHAQKLFEIGESGTLGLVCYGMGGLQARPYRTLAAELSDAIKSNQVDTFDKAVHWWKDAFWSLYEQQLGSVIQQTRDLLAKSGTGGLTDLERKQFEINMSHQGGFCLGGWLPPNRSPRATQISYSPLLDRTNSISELTPAPVWRFWACTYITDRVITGLDGNVRQMLLNSGRWNGTPQDLDAVLQPLRLQPYGHLPLREAVDWIFSMIYATIKGCKFSILPPLCGGPIDIAVITSDRPFRWVRHKRIGAALSRDEHHPPGEV